MRTAAVSAVRKPVRLRGSERGFTLLELMAVMVIIAFVMAMLLPALSKSKARAEGIYCLSNIKQLQMAWEMYAGDHQEWLPGVVIGSGSGPGRWVSGWLDTSSSPDNTNTTFLTDARYSQLAPYLKGFEVYHCPSDRSTAQIGGHSYQRVRSESMNCWMNYTGNNDIGQDTYQIFRKINQIMEPPPGEAWVFIDESAETINDGLFQTNLKARGNTTQIVDYPASNHDLAAGVSFADGHAIIKRWLDHRTTAPLKTSQLIQLAAPVSSPNNTDILWLQDHASTAKAAAE